MSSKRVERRGRGVLVGFLGGRSPSFCSRVLKSGNIDLRELPTGFDGGAAEQRVLKGQLLPAPLHPKSNPLHVKASPYNPHSTSSGLPSR